MFMLISSKYIWGCWLESHNLTVRSSGKARLFLSMEPINTENTNLFIGTPSLKQTCWQICCWYPKFLPPPWGIAILYRLQSWSRPSWELRTCSDFMFDTITTHFCTDRRWNHLTHCYNLFVDNDLKYKRISRGSWQWKRRDLSRMRAHSTIRFCNAFSDSLPDTEVR